MLLALLMIAQQAHRSTDAINCSEKFWSTVGVPYSEPGGPPQRYLVLSNGPEQLGDDTTPAGADHVNLYWGKIPFEGTDLRMRVYLDHLIYSKSQLDNLDIRFCMGVRDGQGIPVKVVRRVSVFVNTPPDQPRQYIDPGQKLALAHLGQNWPTVYTGAPIPVPDDSQAGDVADVGMTLSQSPENKQYGNLVAELDLKADRALAGRTLVVRTVARKAGGGLGVCRDEGCTQAGAGERGWWPQADIYVRSDPKSPVLVKAGGAGPYASYFSIIHHTGVEWAFFNRTDDKGTRVTNNAMDTYGTKNSGLWGVNILYRVYVRALGEDAPVSTSIGGLNVGLAGGHVVSGPFVEGDSPWQVYAKGQLKVASPGYLSRRSPTDYDIVDLGEAGTASDSPRYFEYFVANAGASVLPTAWFIRQPPGRK
jgi:hypothetical protein